jgi:hypothetical protein
MVRADTAADARHASTFLTPGNGIAFQRRLAPGDVSRHTAGAKSGKAWVRVERNAGIVTGYESADGTTWTKIDSADLGLSTRPALIGLAVTAHDNAKLCTAVFEQVTLVMPGSTAQ